MAPLKVLAIAIGNSGNDRVITNWSNVGPPVRPYIPGLLEGLANFGQKIGTDYTVEYRERSDANLPQGLGQAPTGGGAFDVILCMSTTVVRAAKTEMDNGHIPVIPIVGIVSDPADEEFSGVGNICGVSARRHQTAGDCLDRFVRTVPSLTQVVIFHKKTYGPSEQARARIIARASRQTTTITVNEFPISTDASLNTALGNLPNLPAGAAPTVGLLVLPIDLCFARAADIVSVAQGNPHNVPTFFPTTDWVKASPASVTASALGGFGVSQRTCGELLAERVYYVFQNKNVMPLPPPRYKDAPDSSFEWWASGPIAGLLNIQLSAEVPVMT